MSIEGASKKMEGGEVLEKQNSIFFDGFVTILLVIYAIEKKQLNVNILHKSKIYGRSIVNLFVPLYTVLPSFMQNVFYNALLLSVCIAVFLWRLNEEF